MNSTWVELCMYSPSRAKKILPGTQNAYTCFLHTVLLSFPNRHNCHHTLEAFMSINPMSSVPPTPNPSDPVLTQMFGIFRALCRPVNAIEIIVTRTPAMLLYNPHILIISRLTLIHSHHRAH